MNQQQDQTLAELRHLYLQLVSGAVKDAAQAKRIAEGLLGPVIAKLETQAAQAQRAPQSKDCQRPECMARGCFGYCMKREYAAKPASAEASERPPQTL